MQKNLCVICSNTLEEGETVKLRSKGAYTINKASTERGTPSITVAEGQTVHIDCRKKHVNTKPNRTPLKRKCPEKHALRSQTDFSFKDKCFLCGTNIYFDPKHISEAYPVRTFSFQRTILSACEARADEWGDTVRCRINCARDLPAADAIYHKQCSSNFQTHKHIPSKYCDSVDKEPPRKGRKVDDSRQEAFLLAIEDLICGNDDEQTTVVDLVDRMSQLCPGVEAYSVKYMKQKLISYFGDALVIGNVRGRSDVVTIKETAAKILQQFKDSQETDDEEVEKRKIVRAAARLIKADIKNIDACRDFYPDSSELQSLAKNVAYVPQSLRILLQETFSGKSCDLEVASIGQSIVQLTRPRAIIAPIQYGLAIQMHQHFGSRFLVDSLHSHGFCLRYSEVVRFSKCAANIRGTSISTAGRFGQFVADNVDHNLRTLDGRGTYHGMGIIAAITPGVRDTTVIPRVQSPENNFAAAQIEIKYYRSYRSFRRKGGPLAFRKLDPISASDNLENLDILWKTSWLLRPKRPGWSGLMQSVCRGPHPGKASVHFLPMIDMDPTDMSCIYSTLHFVAAESHRQGVTPMLTFDQPLYWKAKMINVHVKEGSELAPIVVNLGGFHSVMSFLGCMGQVMEASGLKEVLELIYAENAVTQILSCKAYARAIRGHFLVGTALSSVVLGSAYGIDLSIVDEESDACKDFQEAADLLDKLLCEDASPGEVCSKDVLNRISEKLKAEKNSLSEHKMGKLWSQYMDMIDLLRRFLRALRMGDFQLYLGTLQEMLPYFAACGHNNYAKSAHVYIQDMIELEKINPDMFRQLNSGLFVIRRSDRLWAGLPSDLVIE